MSLNSNWGQTFRNGNVPEVEEGGVANVTKHVINEYSDEYPLANLTFTVSETQAFHEFEASMKNHKLGKDMKTDLILCRLNDVLETFFEYLFVLTYCQHIHIVLEVQGIQALA